VNWYVLLAPAATPRDIVLRLNAEAVRAINASDLRERLAGIGGEPVSGSPEDAAAFLAQEYEQWGKVIREAHITAE
jgi:tripartite-type tricarboxylate transporter receptor subunit TctC